MKKQFQALGHNIAIAPAPAGPDQRMIADVAAGNMQTAAALNMAPPPGTIGSEQIRKATTTLLEYQTGKSSLDNRIVENEQWYKRRHWEYIRAKQAKIGEVEPASAWLFNNLASKHADLMDNYPDSNILPREAADEGEADSLTSIVPVVMERNEYEQTYSDTGWYFLKNGLTAIGYFWDPDKENGLGEISIKKLNILNLFWEPGVTDIQDGANFFIVSSVNEGAVKSQYPWLPDGANTSITVVEYLHDESIDKTKKKVIVDWYYKIVTEDGRTLLHYAKFIGEYCVFASENATKPDGSPAYPNGWYDHGLYPVVIDVLYPEEDSPAGFGLVDLMKEPQLYIDKLDSIIMRNAMMAGKKRFMTRVDSGINEEEFCDLSKDVVHVTGTLDERNYREIDVKPLDGFIIQHKQMKIDEQKETSANRDFSQGGVTGGVTAASAIAALQEAGNKNSRDINKCRYRGHKKGVYFVIELIRQFYDEPRKFRIMGDTGAAEYIAYSNAKLKTQTLLPAYPGAEQAFRTPVFDIKVVPQRANPFNKAAQNELAMAMYQQGVFAPPRVDEALILLDMMDIEGKQKLIQKITQNGEAFKILNQLMMLMQQAQGGGPAQPGQPQKQEEPS
jgi:hypothetical protein